MEAKTLQLQPRLHYIAGCVGAGARLADVGTDHGYLPVYLLQRGHIASAIASDINAMPLAHARATAREYGVAGISFRLCPGLARIRPEECDTVAIAGMGGETIIAILAAAPWTRDGAHTLILQPQTKVTELRRWLAENGYRFEAEQLVRDKDQLYTVLTVRGGEGQTLSEADALAGVLLRDDPLYGEYLDLHLAKLTRAADGLARSSRADRDARIAHLRALTRALTERREEWSNADRT